MDWGVGWANTKRVALSRAPTERSSDGLERGSDGPERGSDGLERGSDVPRSEAATARTDAKVPSSLLLSSLKSSDAKVYEA